MRKFCILAADVLAIPLLAGCCLSDGGDHRDGSARPWGIRRLHFARIVTDTLKYMS